MEQQSSLQAHDQNDIILPSLTYKVLKKKKRWWKYNSLSINGSDEFYNATIIRLIGTYLMKQSSKTV